MASARLVRRLTLGLCVLLGVQVAAALADAVLPPPLAKAGHASPVALDRNGAWLRALPVDDGRWRIRADLDRTDPSFVNRLIAVEDARFAYHPGVDPLAIVRASVSGAAHGRVRSGASTLTMQTARMLQPRPRTLGAKLIETARALQLEARYSKGEILALYLTLAPYGGNLEGVRAASLAYFGHEPQSLTLGEQALLIALPQSPEARRPERRPAAARAARQAVLAKLVHAGAVTPAQAEEAGAEPIPGRARFPALAWHAAGEAAIRAPAGQARVVTTIDAGLQGRLEKLAAATAAAQGASSAAAIIVVDIKSRAVRASVGTSGLDRPGGWLDMTRALRSPGSALKPFIYGFAFDDGVAAPDTMIEDSPRLFVDYEPENFDRVFHGKVTARDALIHSLNVPAVATLQKIGPEAFQHRIEASGARLVRAKGRSWDAGLALALGGEGITLRDMALLYCALADGGVAKPLAWTEAEAARRPRQPGARILRQETAAQVLDILRETAAPAGRMPALLARSGGRMAFKTGTSYGFRDALAAGVVGDHVVVVWTGRPDGGARGGMTGREASLPLLFDAADAIDPPAASPPPLAPSAAPQALTRLEREDAGPRLIFPPNGAAVQVASVGPASAGLVLAASGEDLSWYVNGRALASKEVSGKVVWRPEAPGFYRVTVVDAGGRKAEAKVRIRAGR
jgi:penicillin-binding protein 1C